MIDRTTKTVGQVLGKEAADDLAMEAFADLVAEIMITAALHEINPVLLHSMAWEVFVAAEGTPPDEHPLGCVTEVVEQVVYKKDCCTVSYNPDPYVVTFTRDGASLPDVPPRSFPDRQAAVGYARRFMSGPLPA